MAKTAVVLFNLGGPDSLEAVRPFLFNLFNDPAIIGAPQPVRWALAQFISRRRAPIAREIYAHLGGGSPLLPNTQAQARALEQALGSDTRVFIAMRYWRPFAAETVAAVTEWDPDEIILAPLYPQFSTTTSGSSLKDWAWAAASAGLDRPTRTICCYPSEAGFIGAVTDLIRPALDTAAAHGSPRLLLTAHGLPKKIVDAGDPYQIQVEMTAAAIVDALGRDGLDSVVCYQSRVGPLEWIGPATDAEIKRAGSDGVPVVIAPIAFVSEHSETLVELDIEYGALAKEAGVPAYIRVPTVDAAGPFIGGLAGLIRKVASEPAGVLRSQAGGRLCPSSCGGCAMAG